MGSTLLSSINIGRETLMSHGSAMATLSDNVSNSNTTGFKSGTAVFADLLSSGAGSVGVIDGLSGGDGSLITTVASNLTQGALDQTNKPYDLGIDGEGFFTLAKPDGNGDATADLSYSRAGGFQLDAKGRLVNSDGYLVMSTPIGGGALTPITLTGRDALPVPTTKSTIIGNLDAATTVLTQPLPAEINDNTQLQRLRPFNTALRVIDSLGKSHDIGLSFFKTGFDAASGETTWSVRAFANGDEVIGGTAGAPVQVGALESLVIGPDGAVKGTPTLTAKAAWANGTVPTDVTVDFSGFSGFARESFIATTVSDGSVSGIAKSIGFDPNGQISVVLDTGERTPIGVLALARFPNEQGLKRQGNSLFTSTTTSGEVSYDAPRSKGRGSLQQGALESSNVDLADQFVNIIRIQRTYQAGSQVIKTADELLSSTIQIA